MWLYGNKLTASVVDIFANLLIFYGNALTWHHSSQLEKAITIYHTSV